MNIFNSLLPQLVKYDVHTTRKINSIHAIFYHILSFYCQIWFEVEAFKVRVCPSKTDCLSSNATWILCSEFHMGTILHKAAVTVNCHNELHTSNESGNFFLRQCVYSAVSQPATYIFCLCFCLSCYACYFYKVIDKWWRSYLQMMTSRNTAVYRSYGISVTVYYPQALRCVYTGRVDPRVGRVGSGQDFGKLRRVGSKRSKICIFLIKRILFCCSPCTLLVHVNFKGLYIY